MDIDLHELPIPDWGLVCPFCEYLLKGLPTHRCPECGRELDIPALVRPWTRLRDPRFTGRELPVPDYGLRCTRCQAPLAGAERLACPQCDSPFDPTGLPPRTKWFTLDRQLCADLPIPGVEALLAAEDVPHFSVHEMTLSEIYGGQSVMIDRLRVPSEFFFDVLWLLRRARLDMEAARAAGPAARWRCGKCGAKNPGHFEICWKCEHARGP